MTVEHSFLQTSHSLGRAAALLAKQVELAIVDTELSLPQYRVLSVLDEGSSLPSALAQRLAVRPPSVTAVIDGLVGRGLVDREPVEDDRRQISLVLTDKGRRALAQADAAADKRLRSIAGHLEPDQAGRLLDDLGLWREAMRDFYLKKVSGT